MPTVVEAKEIRDEITRMVLAYYDRDPLDLVGWQTQALTDAVRRLMRDVKKGGGIVNTEVTVTCPHAGCGRTVDAEIGQGLAATYWDPPEPAEIESAKGCRHARDLTPKLAKAIWEAASVIDKAAAEAEYEWEVAMEKREAAIAELTEPLRGEED